MTYTREQARLDADQIVDNVIGSSDAPTDALAKALFDLINWRVDPGPMQEPEVPRRDDRLTSTGGGGNRLIPPSELGLDVPQGGPSGKLVSITIRFDEPVDVPSFDVQIETDGGCRYIPTEADDNDDCDAMKEMLRGHWG
jgi:hypothetical protein